MSEPGTSGPGTSGPGTSGPGTSGPGTSEPGTSEPGTSEPHEPQVRFVAEVIAEPAQRLVARLVDMLLVGVPVAATAAEGFPRQTAQVVVAPIAFAVVLFVYDAGLVALYGRTLGKRLTGIRVVSVDDAPLRAGQVLVRSAIFALPPAARPVPVLNVVAVLFWLGEIGLLFEGAHRQALHDRLAGTLVVRDARDQSSRS